MTRLIILPFIVLALFLVQPVHAQKHAGMDSLHSEHMEMMQDSTMKKNMMKRCMKMMRKKMKEMHNMDMQSDSIKSGGMMMKGGKDRMDHMQTNGSSKQMLNEMKMPKMCMVMCMHMMKNKMGNMDNEKEKKHHKEGN